jgi:YtkA-like protein
VRRLALVLALAGCARVPSAAPLAPGDVRSNGDAWIVRFATTPDPIAVGSLFSLDVAVLDAASGAPPASDVSLAVDARMPEHGHGMNVEPQVTPKGGGRFAVSGMQFHMAGKWEIDFDVTRGAVTERAQVEKVMP